MNYMLFGQESAEIERHMHRLRAVYIMSVRRHLTLEERNMLIDVVNSVEMVLENAQDRQTCAEGC